MPALFAVLVRQTGRVKLLVIGGGRFFGASLVDQALAGGWEVTVLQRGETSRAVPGGAEWLRGDRDGPGLDLLAGRSWDAVVDTCGYFPRVVRASASLLAGSVGRYVFISSVSAYAPSGGAVMTEGMALAEWDGTAEEITDDSYGGFKAQCEEVIDSVFGSLGLSVRPGLIVGPNDPTERFSYWTRRLAEGGQVLMPVGPSQPFQVIDARDLAGFVLRCIADSRTGFVNAVGPALTFGALLDANSFGAEPIWASEEWLLSHGVEPWSHLPVWLPSSESLLADATRALEWGLEPRPLHETSADTLAWDRSRGFPPQPTTLSREREAELVAEITSTRQA